MVYITYYHLSNNESKREYAHFTVLMLFSQRLPEILVVKEVELIIFFAANKKL